MKMNFQIKSLKQKINLHYFRFKRYFYFRLNLFGNTGKIKLMKNYGAKIGREVNYLSEHVPDLAELQCLSIGDYVTISNDVRLVFHDGSIGPLINRNPIFCNKYTVSKQGNIKIGNNVFIGVSSVILSVDIGEYSIIGAGSIVTKCVPPFEVWGGGGCKIH
ncbi:MAG: DapH/DapD/GlmU-related protein [Paludibacter sp.]|nr:DapH/DapD/GlmU-related protein [Paludibacter sp.]MDD4072535.1 DapH/DapD/GlmU-related protein [Desulfobacterales bacterium]MDD4428537.1 DapH/DapD/GlmU-related protein [Paludibacter sp.]